jgi:hypothetical protein
VGADAARRVASRRLPPDDLGLTFEAERHPVRFFNWHPLLMMTAFGLTLSQALLAFRLCDLPWRTRKIVHVALHVGSIVFMSLGLAAIVRFKRVMGETQFFSVHSWVGISTFSAYVLQFTLGAAFILWPRLFLWLLPAHESFIREALPWHVLAGLAIFLGAAVTTITGLLNRQWLFIVFKEDDGDLFSARFMVAGVAALAVLLLAWTVYFHHKGKPSYSHRRDVTA